MGCPGSCPSVLTLDAEEEEAGFEGGGGNAKKTQEDSARTMKMFKVMTSLR